MAKACDCGFILEALERDPRLAYLPLAARMLWLVLVRRMQALGHSVLLFGSEIPNRREIAMMVAVPETELETHLAPLLARGLLMAREDGALECPLLAARLKRAETARINGLKGGRPRKDRSPPEQRTLMMGIAGGADGADAKTQREPGAAAVGSVAKLAKPSEEKAKQAELPADWKRICDAAMEAAGFDPVRWQGHCGMVASWWRAGASEALILATIRRVMARTTKVPQHFGFFDAAMKEAMQAEGGAVQPVAGADPQREAKAAAFNAELDRWVAGGCVGPMPVWECAA